MDDYISRQATIDALDGLCDRECEYSKKQRHTMCGACHLGSAFDVIEQLPPSRENLVNNSDHIVNYLANDTNSRQTAIDMIERYSTWSQTYSNMVDDAISRQAAIDEIDEWIKAFRENGHKESAADACLIQDGIIQLPSAQPEPCEDTVSREMIMRHYDSGEYKHINHISRNGLLDYIEQFPSTQPEQQWIPCSERLPEEDQICIVTDDTQRCAYEYGFHNDTYDEVNGWTYLGHKIIAWMPLPEPWRGEE